MANKLEDQIKEFTDTLKTYSSQHPCNQTSTFGMLSDQIKANKDDISSNDKSIKRLYTWQATVGISLLVFFLTVGVAALRYVDKIDFSVQTNAKSITRIEKVLEDKKVVTEPTTPLTRKELKKIILDALSEGKDQ